MTTKTLFRSFAGGEIAPELFGRLDLVKFQTGLAKALNFEILPHGPASNRTGWQYVIETKDSTARSVLIPFIYNTSQSYQLEFGDQYMRIHTEAGTVLEASQNITGVTQAATGVLTYAGADPTNGQWFYLAGIGGMTQLNGRYVVVANVNAGANTFELNDTAGNPIDTSAYGAYTAGGTMARVYEISTPYIEADLFDLHYTQSADVLTIVHPGYQQRELRRAGATTWNLTTLSLAPTIGTPTAPTGTPSGAGAENNTYVTTAVASDGLEESLASASVTITGVTLATAGAFNTIDPTPGGATVSGAVRYNIYKLISGLYGYIGQTDGSDFRDNNITPDVTQTPPLANNPFNASGDYPGAVGYFKGRRWFGGTNNKPQNLWGTRSGTESNMTYSIPTQDNDSIAVRLTSRQANTIRHIVPLGDMLLLTSGAEWLIKTQNSDALTPSTIDYTPQGYIGASNVQPVVTNKSVLYPQARGGRIREMLYKWESQGYDTNDISIMAPHLFDGYTITSMAYAAAPYPTVWCVRSDGILLGLTYVPEHQVAAWHQHDTDGLYESVAVTPEGTEDSVYAIIKRTLNGRTVRTIERKHTRAFASLADCFFVDSGLTYDGAPTLTIGGLWHLIGETVAILRDGAVEPQQVVAANGTVTLETEGEKVHIGLPYNADLQTLPLSMEMQAFGQGTRKNVNRVHLRVNQSSSIYVGPLFDKLKQVKQRTDEPYGSPPALRTGMVSALVTPTWSEDGQICVRQSDPLPLTVVSLVPEVAA